ncbi:MAG: hypothetical protein B7Z55_12095 [Planctomycetales bacterium 12-60-4]|nr:MAG: hypothetical protein B7Z55_12095 [Planctomycetales bacterium 12-60-4]
MNSDQEPNADHPPLEPATKRGDEATEVATIQHDPEKTVGPGAAIEGCQFAGGTVAGYQIVSELGRGGMGIVYRAIQLRANRDVALKVVRAGGQAQQEELVRFRGEAEAVARLQHPHVVAVYDVGEHDGQPYFSMEYCPRGSLAATMRGATGAVSPTPSTVLADDVSGVSAGGDTPTGMWAASAVTRSETTCRLR